LSLSRRYWNTTPPKAGDTYPLWDGKFRHSIRADGKEGFLLPYHDYLQTTGDEVEDARRRALLSEIAVVPESVDVMSFSYAGELARADVALSVSGEVPGCSAKDQKARYCGGALGKARGMA
jgi:hypothetical protein